MRRLAKLGDVVEVYLGVKYVGAWIIEDDEMTEENEDKFLLKMLDIDNKMKRLLILKQEVSWESERLNGLNVHTLVAKLRTMEVLK